jgi:hypothetical protein
MSVVEVAFTEGMRCYGPWDGSSEETMTAEQPWEIHRNQLMEAVETRDVPDP